MRRLLIPLIATCLLASCGSTHPTRTPKGNAPACSVVPAQAGCSLPKTKGVAPPTAGHVFPDLSEYQGCPRFYGPVIFKVYEGGYGQDHSASCNIRRAHALGTWAGVYAFLRPQNCAGQGYATASIVRQLGGVPGPVVADAEVALPTNCVSQFLNSIRTHLGGPTDIYTSPGTWPGGSLTAPLWVATYGSRPGCVAGQCSHVAWQFTDNGNCGGLGGTDCSVSSGILSQTRVDGRKATLYADYRRRGQLRGFARARHCYTPRVQQRARACKVWGAEVRVLEARIHRLHSEGVY